MRFFSLVLFCLIGLSGPLRAGTVTPLSFEIRFEIREITRACYDAGTFDLVGTGPCGYNQRLGDGTIRFSGQFETEDGTSYRGMPREGAVRRGCVSGFCGLKEVDSFRFHVSEEAAQFTMFDSFFIEGRFDLDFSAGTGTYSWTDDAAPVWSTGTAQLENVALIGLQAAPSNGSPPVVPLPAGLPLLLAGIAGFGVLRQRGTAGS